MVALVVAVLIVAITAQPQRASAHFEGGKWPWAAYHHLLWLNYQTCTPWNYRTQDAAWDYNGPPNEPVWFSRVYSGCQPHDTQMDVFTGYNSNPNIEAWTNAYDRDCFIWCWWDADWGDPFQSCVIRVNVNGSVWTGADTFDEVGVLAHEMGHCLGLAHAGWYAGEANGAYSIMDYCCLGYNTLKPHDISDLNALYPGW
jgi:hypothetical protein